MRHLLLTFALLSTSAFGAPKITVSGISAGAYMAQQFHTAFSSEVSGVGMIAGGPYYCSRGKMFEALNRCMKTSFGTPTKEETIKVSRFLSDRREIDSLSNLRSSKVYILSGTKDETVQTKVVDVNAEVYKAWGLPNSNIVYEKGLEVGHAFPTDSFGNACDTGAKAPFVSNCGKDVAGEMLNHLLGKLKPRVTAKEDRLFSFHQLGELQDMDIDKLSMAHTGFAYVPENCERGMNYSCQIHVAFHGCLQSVDDVGTAFVMKAGYNAWAESNNIIVLYPQAKKSLIMNPNGCWDWWGYTGPKFHTKSGTQMRVVKRMVEALRSGKLQLTREL